MFCNRIVIYAYRRKMKRPYQNDITRQKCHFPIKRKLISSGKFRRTKVNNASAASLPSLRRIHRIQSRYFRNYFIYSPLYYNIHDAVYYKKAYAGRQCGGKLSGRQLSLMRRLQCGITTKPIPTRTSMTYILKGVPRLYDDHLLDKNNHRRNIRGPYIRFAFIHIL